MQGGPPIPSTGALQAHKLLPEPGLLKNRMPLPTEQRTRHQTEDMCRGIPIPGPLPNPTIIIPDQRPITEKHLPNEELFTPLRHGEVTRDTLHPHDHVHFQDRV